MEKRFDTIIIGAGPGGLEAARLAATQGGEVAVIEGRQAGGTCLNRGCIPTKCLNASAAEAADKGFEAAALRMQGIVSEMSAAVAEGLRQSCTFVEGFAEFVSADTVRVGDDLYTAPRIIIATGSQPSRLPIPGAELAITSDEFLALDEAPASVTIIGGGVIGLEIASILNAFGTEVTVLEYCKEVLPGFDSEVAKRLRTYLTRRGIRIVTSAAVTAINPDLSVSYQTKRGEQTAAPAQAVLMATGRRPLLPPGLEATGIEPDRRGCIPVDDSMYTGHGGIYAIGDVNGRCMLAHAAEAQARAMFGLEQNLALIPSAVFTMPEAAAVGLTDDAREGLATAKAGFGTNGKAQAMGQTDGLVKLVYDATTGRLEGAHIVGPHASDLIATATLAIAAGMTVKQLAAHTIFAHPTLPEALIAAARAAR